MITTITNTINIQPVHDGLQIQPLNKNSLQRLKRSLPYKNSIATVCLKGNNSIYDKLDAIASAGFNGVEIMDVDLEEASATDIYHYCKSKELQVTLYQPFRDFEGQRSDSNKFRETLIKFKQTLTTMDELNTDLLLICANCEDDSINDKDLFVEQLRIAADLAMERNIKIAYEALSWSTHINTLEDLYDIVVRVDRPNFGLCLDSFHIVSRGCDLELIREIGLNNKIFFVQLCDAPYLKLDDLRFYARNYRNYPYQGDYDLIYQIKLIHESGFKGWLSLEVFNDSFRSCNSPKALADDGFRSLSYLQKKYIENSSQEHDFKKSDISIDTENSDPYEKIFSTPASILGCLNHSHEIFYTENLQNLNLSVLNKSVIIQKSKLLGYEKLFNKIIRITDSNSVEEILCNRVVSKTSSRLEFNREVLFLKTCLDLEVIKDDSYNLFNEYGLPLSLSFGNSDGFAITLAIHNDSDVKL